MIGCKVSGNELNEAVRQELKMIVSHRCGSSVFSQKGWQIMQALSYFFLTGQCVATGQLNFYTKNIRIAR